MPEQEDSGRWLVRPRRRTERPPVVRLLCLPYAGAGATAYIGWAALLPAEVELWLVQPPGRENRIREEPYRTVPELAEAAAEALAPLLTLPFGLFGHSMGALLAYELGQHLRERHGLVPRLLAVSGRVAPDRPGPPPLPTGTADPELLAATEARYGRTPAVVRSDPSMLARFLRVLRADAAMLNAYRFRPRPPLPCPVSAFAGTEDPDASPAQMAAWQPHGTGAFTVAGHPGGHFFLHAARAELAAAVAAGLLPVVPD